MMPMCDGFRTTSKQWLPAMTASSAMIIVGTDTYWFMHAIDHVYVDRRYYMVFGISLLIGFISSLIIGTIAGAVITDKLGRHKSLLIGATLGIIPSIAWFSAETVFPWITLYFGAIGNFITRIALPVYVSEISNDEIRGAMMLFQLFFFHVGKCLAHFLAIDLPAYALFIALVLIYGTYLYVFTKYPDTPYYYAMIKRYDMAKESLAVFRGIPPSVDNEAIEDVTNAVEANGNDQLFCQKIRTLFSGRYLRALTIIVVLLLVRFNEMVFSAVANIILSWDLPNTDYESLIISDSITFFIIFALVFGVDVVGRRPMTMFSISIGFAAAMVYIWMAHVIGLIIIADFLLHFFQMTLYAIPTIFIGEFFPTNIKVIASAFFVFLEELIKWAIFIFNEGRWGWVGMGWTLGIYLTGLVLSLILVLIYVPETKKKTYFGIQNELDRTLVIDRLDVTRCCRDRSESQILES